MVNPDNQPAKNDKPASNADLDYLAWLTLMAMEAKDAADRAPPSQSQYVSPPASVEVMPGLPNPNSNRVYQLQVGAFSNDNALRVAQQLRSLGYGASMGHIGNNIFGVSVIGIPAQHVANTIQRLGALGFRQIWVRE
jgi:hypothetical protein